MPALIGRSGEKYARNLSKWGQKYSCNNAAQHYKAQFGEIITIGVGDSPNDAPMLQEVDFPYLVQRPDGQWRRGIEVNNLTKVSAIGPLGFTEMVKDIKQRWIAQN